MKKPANTALRLAAIAIALATPSFADDTTYDTVAEVKVFSTWADLVLSNDTHSCGTGSGATFKIPIENGEMIRLAEAAWLAGKEVRLKFACGTIGGGTNALVSGVRAR